MNFIVKCFILLLFLKLNNLYVLFLSFDLMKKTWVINNFLKKMNLTTFDLSSHL